MATLTTSKRHRVLICLCELVAIACLVLLSVKGVAAQQSSAGAGNQAVVERIEIVGNRRIESGTIRRLIHLSPGDRYSVEAVRRGEQALRNSGFFADVRSEVEDSPDRSDGKIVAFYVTEKPIIRRIEYRGIKSISESDVHYAFQKERVGLSVETQFDQAKIARAADVIRQLLAEHDHPHAIVKISYESIPRSTAVVVVFNVDEGPKAEAPKDLP